jgi:DNA-binding MarR family transcriptional regulator
MRQSFNQAVSEQGLFSGQQDIVIILTENEGITLSELANILEVSTATASVSIKRMEKAGFVEKRVDENDARITRLYPTDKAKQAPENIRKKMDSLESVIKKGMTKQQSEELSELLEIAIQNMLERGEEE